MPVHIGTTLICINHRVEVSEMRPQPGQSFSRALPSVSESVRRRLDALFRVVLDAVERLDDPLILVRLRIVGFSDIVGLSVAPVHMPVQVHMIGFGGMAAVNMAPVRSVRAALTHMVMAGMVATVPVRR